MYCKCSTIRPATSYTSPVEEHYDDFKAGMKQRASASSLSSPPPKPTYPREESPAVGYPPHFCRRRDRHHRPSSRGRCFRFTPSRRSVFFSRSGPGAVSEVQLQHTRPLPSACARHRRLLASSGRLRSDWLEARVGWGMAAHGPLTEPEAPHPARPTERERRRTPEREATPGSFSSPASLYCVRRHQQPLSRSWETREEEEAAAVSRRARSGRYAACHPKAGREGRMNPTQPGCSSPPPPPFPLPAAGSRGCAAANAFASSPRSPQTSAVSPRSRPTDQYATTTVFLSASLGARSLPKASPETYTEKEGVANLTTNPTPLSPPPPHPCLKWPQLHEAVPGCLAAFSPILPPKL
ncbi:uncharacterized protein LOC112542693 [Python bivittatus]|uniref:Uncharacterized protein LOC112542693 n=1 Tax=Python bivittatus TaxID=176946 RepID=A0A9F5MZC7_PYTBI|nr:uncharacterized protein LOC112542693 [Python bivittatus]